MKQKLTYYEVESTPKMSFRCTLSRFMAIRCVAAVNYGYFSCSYNSRIGFSMQNVYVNKLNIVLLYAFCSDDIMQVICTE